MSVLKIRTRPPGPEPCMICCPCRLGRENATRPESTHLRELPDRSCRIIAKDSAPEVPLAPLMLHVLITRTYKMVLSANFPKLQGELVANRPNALGNGEHAAASRRLVQFPNHFSREKINRTVSQ